MYLLIGSLKLLNIKVLRNGEVIYEGMVEDAPDEVKALNYTKATFCSGVVELEVD